MNAPHPSSEPGTQIVRRRLQRTLAAAAACGLVGLALTVLPMTGVGPLRLALSLAVGQPLLAVSVVLFLVAVWKDLHRRKVL